MKPVCLLTAALVIGLLFSLPAKAQVEGGAIAAVDEPSEGGGGGGAASGPAVTPRGPVRGSRTSKAGRSKPPAAPTRTTVVRPPVRRWDGFVVGDEYTFMNFEVLSAEKPYHTRAAKAGGASGLVQVEILIETDGRVLKARARTGNKLLHPEAERAALASRFPAYKFGGKPARAIGFLVYRFGSRDSAKRRPCLQDSDGFKSPLREWTALPFDSGKWLAGDRWVRARMRQDVFDRRIPNGKSAVEVASLFGQPDAKQTIEGREVWLYHINTGEAGDINMLAISFDTKSRAYVGMSQGGKLLMGGRCGKIFPFDSDTF